MRYLSGRPILKMMGTKKKTASKKQHFPNGLIEQFRKSAAKPDKKFIEKALKKSKDASSSRPASILDRIPYRKIIKTVSQH